MSYSNVPNNILEHIDKYSDFISWARWHPDLWYDLITPETGGIRLGLDQRVFLRSTARFIHMYGVFPRGYGKTMKEFMGMTHAAIFFPDIELAMTAQTKENAASIIKDKWYELVKFYPLLENELSGKPSFQQDSVLIPFKSGGRIDVLANHNSSKGQRRKRINIEEAALLNNHTFEEALEPIVVVPRRTVGKLATINPQEMHGQIHFFTTSYFRGTTEYERNVQMFHDMVNLKGKIVLGSDWQLATHYGRGEPKSAILKKKETLSPVNFAQNYESKWVGAVDGAIVDIQKLILLRNIEKPLLKNDGRDEIVLSVDVARSQSDSNNKTVIAVLRIVRNREKRIETIDLVNLISLPNGLNFSKQSLEIKRVKKHYKASMVIFDENGIGKGLKDELLKETIDPDNDENLGCWDTINTTDVPDKPRAEKILYALNASGINDEIITFFMGAVESEKLQLLIKNNDNSYDVNDINYTTNHILPHIQTDMFVEEVANLQIEKTKTGKMTVNQVTKKIDKDRYSAVAMGLWYILQFMNKPVRDNSTEEVLRKMKNRIPSYFRKAKR